MSPLRSTPPSDPGPGAGDLYDVHSLAARLGITVGTMRQHVHAKPSWLPTPQKFGNKLVWPASVLEGIEERRPLPGRPRIHPLADQKPGTYPARVDAGSPTVTAQLPTADLLTPLPADPDGWWEG